MENIYSYVADNVKRVYSKDTLETLQERYDYPAVHALIKEIMKGS